MPVQNAHRLRHVAITVGGSDLPRGLMNDVIDVVVDTSLHLPAMFTMRFQDEQLEWMGGDTFELGAAVEIKFGDERNQLKRVIAGEITAIEPEFSRELHATLVVRGYDRSHRLNRGTKSKVFVQTTDSDIVQQVASAAGLQVEADSTTEVYEHIFQHNQTDLEFLHHRARRIGYEVFVDDRKLYFRKPEGARGENSLDWGSSLHTFYPRLTLARQVDEVIVKGWDVTNKREVVGRASRSEMSPEIEVGGSGGELASQAFSAARQVVIRQPVTSQRDGDLLAQSILDDINSGFVEAEGIADGDPTLVAGNTLTIENVSARFSGNYMVTSASHVYNPEGYEVQFRVEGARPKMMADLMTDASISADHYTWGGVYPAIVTNNVDPEGMARVKVKFPWIDDALESMWARVVAIGAGARRGIMWMPEVNDEVLIAFEHGDFNYPYVMGNLWNGTDAPPEDINQVVKSGRVEKRMLVTRTGHAITFVDDSSGQYIEIKDAEDQNNIKLDMTSKKLIIKSKGEIEIESQTKTTIKSQGELKLTAMSNISIEATGQLVLKGATVNIN